jgi:hypothetical protein
LSFTHSAIVAFKPDGEQRQSKAAAMPVFGRWFN